MGIAVAGVAHFGIPVSDLARSIRFYSEVVGCRLLRTDGKHAFMDAGGICVLLCLENEPVNRPESRDLVHHAFVVPPEQFAYIDMHLAEHGVKLLYAETREGGTVNGPRVYFRDPDGTRLEFINLTSYNTSEHQSPPTVTRS